MKNNRDSISQAITGIARIEIEIDVNTNIFFSSIFDKTY
jgi:hypothetical protein